MKSTEMFSDPAIVDEIKKIETTPEAKKRLDDIRRDIKNRMTESYVFGLIGIIGVLILYSFIKIYALIVIAILIKYWSIYSERNKNYLATAYVNNFLDPVFKKILPGTKIDYFGSMDQAIFENLLHRSDRYTSNCHITFADEYKTEFCNMIAVHDERQNKGKTEEVTDFRGQVLMASVNTGIKGHIRVVPSTQKALGNKSNGAYGKRRGEEKEIQTESIEFNNLYSIFSTDDFNTRFILDARTLELLTDMRKKMKVAIYMNDEYVSIAFQSGKHILTLPIIPQLVDKISLSSEYEEIRTKLADFYTLMNLIMEKF